MSTLYRRSYKPKKQKKRKSGAGNKFPSTVRERIKKRDNWHCVKCGAVYHSIHHIKPRAEGGKGTDINGICVCIPCHRWMDSTPEGREWAEWYRDTVLIGEDRNESAICKRKDESQRLLSNM